MADSQITPGVVLLGSSGTFARVDKRLDGLEWRSGWSGWFVCFSVCLCCIFFYVLYITSVHFSVSVSVLHFSVSVSVLYLS